VQAGLDDIWLSTPQTITVTAGTAPPALSLDIPMPGKPLVLELGRKYAGAHVLLADPLPSGPLAERYRPAYYVADGAGQLRLEGLPAGRRRLRLPDGKIITATIP
jgi:hypothetical protein